MKILLPLTCLFALASGLMSCKPPAPSTDLSAADPAVQPAFQPGKSRPQSGPLTSSSYTLAAQSAPAFSNSINLPPVPGAPRSTLAAAPTPHPASGATEAAIKLYPALGKKDSMFNRAFRDLYNHKKKTDPVALSVPDWPIALAEQTALMLKIQPAPGKTVASATVAPGNIAAAASPSPSWIEERKQRTGALDMPAYDQRRVIYGRYYYYGPYGRYWVDPYGRRQYY